MRARRRRITLRRCCARATSKRAASRAACRWAASSNTSMPARSRRRSWIAAIFRQEAFHERKTTRVGFAGCSRAGSCSDRKARRAHRGRRQNRALLPAAHPHRAPGLLQGRGTQRAHQRFSGRHALARSRGRRQRRRRLGRVRAHHQHAGEEAELPGVRAGGRGAADQRRHRRCAGGALPFAEGLEGAQGRRERAPVEFVRKNPNTVQALTNATVRTLLWMQEAAPQQILAAVPEEYLLGNKAMYLFAFNNVRPAYSKDGYFSEAGARTTLKALASFNPAVKPESINLAETYTNEFVKKAHAKYAKRK